MYFRALHTLLNEVWDERTILAEISRLETQLTPVVAADPWYATAKDWDGNPGRLRYITQLVASFCGVPLV